MPQKQENTINRTPKKASEFVVRVSLDQGEKESLEMMLKEIILNLPLDEESDEELYRSDLCGAQFKLNLYGYEMRALRRLFRKVTSAPLSDPVASDPVP
ncbi:MAG: hypothetical protein GY754_26415 [bacterium]|nr:hypothetical protein [bacterium]